jgi:hypothetical protein
LRHRGALARVERYRGCDERLRRLGAELRRLAHLGREPLGEVFGSPSSLYPRRPERRGRCAMPRAAGYALAGVPNDERGFILCDAHGQIAGTVVGGRRRDGLPIKQGGLAAQQADAAAEAVAARAGTDVEPQPFRPVLRGVLLTGRGQQWTRGSE